MSMILDLCADLPEVSYETGATLLHEGGGDGSLYILIEGALEILKGDLQVNVVTQPGAVFGEISVLLGTPHIATVKTLEPSRLHHVENGHDFLERHPELSLSIARLVAQRLQQVTNYLADIKSQYQDRSDHLGMVDEVLESLLTSQDDEQRIKPGSDREYEPNI